jgi:hypothetical protein
VSGRLALRAAIATAAGISLLALVGCGERPQVIDYKQGSYQGKPDTPAWKDKPWNGNREEWSVALDTRAQNQNEYKRIR